MVKAPPDEEAPDVTAARKPVFVHVDPEQAAVSLVVDPLLILVGAACADNTCDLSAQWTNYHIGLDNNSHFFVSLVWLVM